MTNYTDKSIVSLEGLEPVRARPTAFINSLDTAGQVHIIKELLDNSYDELNNVNYSGHIAIYIFKYNDKYHVLISDNGRGIPLSMFKTALSTLWTSGKIRKDAYTTSSGTYGLGAKCQSALSIRSRAITLRPEGIGTLHISRGVVEKEEILPNTVNTTGTYIYYELEQEWESQGNYYRFQDMEHFYTSGYLDLLKIIKINDIFNETITTKVYLVPTPIPERIWNDTENITIFFEWINTISQSEYLVYDSNTVSDRQQYILEYFHVDSTVAWSLNDLVKKPIPNDPLCYQINLIYTKSRKSGILTLINNVHMQIESNSANVAITNVLYTTLAQYIEDPQLREFFLNRQYKLPLLIAMSIRYSGAQFAGTNKLDFKDKIFAKLFAKELTDHINTLDPNIWKSLVDLFLSDLENKYALYYCKPIIAKDSKKLLLELNNPGNYTACRTKDRSKAELFIVEGTSAGHLKKEIDPEYQAILETRGKPLNAMAISSDTKLAFERLKRNDIFSDLIKVLNVTPYTKDMSECNFGKIIIATDADADGEHIVALYLANLYLLNPLLITSGMVYVATPPLYIMNINNKKIHLRDKAALFDTRISLLYKNIFDIHIKTIAHKEPELLTGKVYRDFCYMVLELGELFDNVSNLLNIPLLILERLVYGIEYLVPNLQLDKLKELFPDNDESGYIKLTYHEKTQILVLSIDDKDIPISVMKTGDTIKQMLLPRLIPIRYKDIEIFITTKMTDAMHMRPCTLMQVYTIMQNINNANFIRMDRYKGLGEMNTKDMLLTIIDPRTRKLFHITDIGDIEYISQLMGKEAYQRKSLMFDCGSIHKDTTYLTYI